MKHKTLPTTEGHFKSFGGETRTRMIGGAYIGLFLGFCIGLTICMVISSQAAQQTALNVLNSTGITPTVQYFMIILATTLFGASAGAAVGIGVPKMKTNPEQGLVKKWKAIPTENAKHHAETIYIAEETRKLRQNNLNNESSPQP